MKKRYIGEFVKDMSREYPELKNDFETYLLFWKNGLLSELETVKKIVADIEYFKEDQTA